MKNTIRISLKGHDKGQQFLKSVLKARVVNATTVREEKKAV